MSDHTAIAGVSRTLRTLLIDRLSEPADVTLAPPDVSPPGNGRARVNLYLYRIGENGFLKNQEIPGQGHPGAYGHPPLSLTLYYLLTTFSATEASEDSDINAQLALGDAMRVLHDYGIVVETLRIRRPEAGPVDDPILDPSLRDQFERVKVVLHPADFDEVSKVWAALPDANFRRSAVYQVSVVQIEPRLARAIARPVRTRRLLASTRFRPEIVEAYRTPAAPGDPTGDIRVRPLEEVTIIGQNTRADRVWVRFGELEPIQVLPEAGGTIRLAVPDIEYPVDADHPATRPIAPEARLQAGPLTVQVITGHAVEGVAGGLGAGVAIAEPRQFFSDQALLQLVPSVAGTAPPQGNAGGLLTVTGDRLFVPGKTSYVLVGDLAIEVKPPRPADPWAPPTATSVQVPLAAARRGLPPPPLAGQAHDVRVQVNGARSREDGFSFTLMPGP